MMSKSNFEIRFHFDRFCRVYILGILEVKYFYTELIGNTAWIYHCRSLCDYYKRQY